MFGEKWKTIINTITQILGVYRSKTIAWVEADYHGFVKKAPFFWVGEISERRIVRRFWTKGLTIFSKMTSSLSVLATHDELVRCTNVLVNGSCEEG